MKTPIDMMLDGVKWTLLPNPLASHDDESGMPFATHEGVLDIGGFKFRCYQLNDGRRVLHSEDIGRFFEGEFGTQERA